MAELILEHYSTEPLVWPPRDYAQERGHRDLSMFKPTGLWVSVKGEDDWIAWCRAEDFRLDHYTTCTRVILSPDANLKIITNEAEIIAFDREYGEELQLAPRFSRHTISWERLAQEYDGIIIAPYVWSCRLPTEWPKRERGKVSDWYYPWDCASGCIWNGTKAIAGFEEVEAPVRPSDQLTEGAASYDGNREAET